MRTSALMSGPVVATVLFAVALAGCAGSRAEARAPQLGGAQPLVMSGQRVLMVPVQTAATVSLDATALEGEIVFALGERDPRVTWITPDELRRAARRSPLFAGNPDALPADAMLHHGERRIVEPLAGELRRFSALVDARLVFLPRVTAHPGSEAGESTLRMSAVMVDARSSDIVWWAELAADPQALRSRAGLAALAEELAQRLLSPGSPGAGR